MLEHTDAILRGRKFRKMIERTFNGIRKKYGLRQIEIEILLYLKRHPDTTSSEICRSLNINKGHVSQAMDNLCRKGFLHSEQNKDDRRYVSFHITSLGETVIEESNALRDAAMKQLFAGFSAEEMEMIQKLSAKLSDNIDRIQLI